MIIISIFDDYMINESYSNMKDRNVKGVKKFVEIFYLKFWNWCYEEYIKVGIRNEDRKILERGFDNGW